LASRRIKHRQAQQFGKRQRGHRSERIPNCGAGSQKAFACSSGLPSRMTPRLNKRSACACLDVEKTHRGAVKTRNRRVFDSYLRKLRVPRPTLLHPTAIP
jgi:hypothetical protein